MQVFKRPLQIQQIQESKDGGMPCPNFETLERKIRSVTTRITGRTHLLYQFCKNPSTPCTKSATGNFFDNGRGRFSLRVEKSPSLCHTSTLVWKQSSFICSFGAAIEHEGTHHTLKCTFVGKKI